MAMSQPPFLAQDPSSKTFGATDCVWHDSGTAGRISEEYYYTCARRGMPARLLENKSEKRVLYSDGRPTRLLVNRGFPVHGTSARAWFMHHQTSLVAAVSAPQR